MAQLHVFVFPDGSELVRMARPREWDHAEWCAEPGCENLARGGYRQRNRNVWGWTEPGGGFIGWRAACSKAHALSVWRRDLST